MSRERSEAWTSWKFIAVLAVAGIVLFGASLVVAGGGHGLLVPLLVLFPFAPIAAQATDRHHDLAAVTVALVQLPLYGLTLRAAKESGRLRAAAIAVAGLHVIAITLASSGWLW